MQLEDSIKNLKSVTPALQKKFARLGIETIRDLLFHFPSRYNDFSNIKPIAELGLGETATIRGVIKKVKATHAWRRRLSMAEAIVQDESGSIRAIWFNQPYLAKTFRVGEVISLAGKLTKSPRGNYFANPAHERIGRNDDSTHTGGLVPVYPETTGLTSRWIRFLTKQAIPLAKKVEDPLPDSLRRRLELIGVSRALEQIHFPESTEEAEKARRRFAFEDVLLIQLRVLRDRAKIRESRAPAIAVSLPLIKKFVSGLPFPLTNAQRKAAWEIVSDTAKSVPMNRLLEGDVGSGKTVVAALAALNAVSRGFQVAYLAPTEILALQHFSTFKNLLSGFEITICLLTASQKKCVSRLGESVKASVGKMAESGEAQIVIGTHAVIQNKVHFKNIGLVIVDEQHRFGVNQRAHLQKRQNLELGIRNQANGGDNSIIHNSSFLIPHFLSMTATPIPRTLALTVYGDLDISLLDQVPSGRKPTLTRVVPAEKRMACYGFIRKEVRTGRQIFIICPRIEAASQENIEHTPRQLLQEEVKTVKAEYETLSKKVFSDLRVRMLHGKMKSAEKEKVMRDFKAHEFDILVSTSVVEVGVDIPNASVMLIEGAEKFGLAQIHQFRGRVGRGPYQSYCFLMTSSPMAIESARLKAVVSAKSGFQLAEKDLAIRGPGDFFGMRQSGIPPFAYKSFSDMKIVQSARTEAAELIKKDPQLAGHQALKKRLEEFEASVHLE